jgi:ParB/RepB/Spo0J family partition protein
MSELALAKQQKPHVEMLPIKSIDVGSNPRKQLGDISDLIASVREKGVLQPVLVRPIAGGRYELAFGQRRHSAAKAGGLVDLPAMIREMTDAEVLEAQIVENMQRADIHPLDEAIALETLIGKHHYQLDDLAAKLGKSSSYVQKRLQLCKLVEAVRKLFLSGKILAGTALAIARIPVAALQEQAARDLTDDEHEPASVTRALALIEARYMLRLAEAQFDIADVQLVPAAGSCAACPKRTGNQVELFSDVKSPDLCTDPSCFREKQNATWKLRVKTAKETRQAVIPDREAKKLFQNGHIAYGAQVVSLDDKDYSQNKTYRQLLPKEGGPAPTLVREPESGRILEVIDRAAAQRLTRKASSSEKPTSTPAEKARKAKEREEEAKRREEEKRANAGAEAVLAELFDVAALASWTKPIWTMFVVALKEMELEYGFNDDVAARRLCIEDTEDEKNAKRIKTYFEPENLLKLSEGDLRSLALELALGESAKHDLRRDDQKNITISACLAFKVDRKKIAAAAMKAAAKDQA